MTSIIKKKKGVKDAMQNFLAETVPLLRRDIRKLVPRIRWEKLTYAGVGTYKTKLGVRTPVPSEAELKKKLAWLYQTLSDKPGLQAFADKRREMNKRHYREAILRVVKLTKRKIMTGGLLFRRMSSFVEGVD